MSIMHPISYNIVSLVPGCLIEAYLSPHVSRSRGREGARKTKPVLRHYRLLSPLPSNGSFWLCLLQLLDPIQCIPEVLQCTLGLQWVTKKLLRMLLFVCLQEL